MARRRTSRLVCLTLGAVCTAAVNAEEPWQALQGTYEGVRDLRIGGRRAYVFGTEMTGGTTPEAAARAFIEQHGGVFEVGELEAVGIRTWTTIDGTSTVLGAVQQIRGVHVEDSVVRVVVRNEAEPKVVFAGVRLAAEPVIGVEHPVVPAAVAAMLVQAHNAHVTAVGEPERVVLRGNRNRGDAWCWRVRAVRSEGGIDRPVVYFLDTLYGQVIHERDDYFNLGPGVQGSVTASGTVVADLLPFGTSSTQLTVHSVPGVRVVGTTPSSQATTFTGSNGQYSLVLGQLNDPVEVVASVGDTTSRAGAWYRLFDFAGASWPSGDPIHDVESDVIGNVVDLQPVSLSSQEYQVAQVDAIVSVSRSRDFARTFIDNSFHSTGQLTVSVNYDAGGQCEAVVQPPSTPNPMGSMIFTASTTTTGCHNYASHSIIPHEYGHIVLGHIFNWTPGEFHEGYADSFAMFVNDDPVQGRHAKVNGTNIREDPSSGGVDCQFPITGSQPNPTVCTCDYSHLAGQLLSGVWVRILAEYRAEYGATAGMSNARSVFGAWTLITSGDDGECNAAHEGTALEILTIAEESMHGRVCNALGESGISCP
jgi:hypothetical protein